MRPIHSSRERRRKIACALLLMLIVDMGDTSRALPYLGDSVQLAVFDPRYGIGRGKGSRSKPRHLEPIDVYSETKLSPRIFMSLFRFAPADFDILFHEMKDFIPHTLPKTLSSRNQKIGRAHV